MTNAIRIIGFVLIAAMVLSLAACTSSNSDDNGDSPEITTGAWAINDQDIQASLPDEVANAFNKATETLTGTTLEPVAYIGSQVVAGTNYMVLCRATSSTETPGATYQLAIIYADLEGNAELTSLVDFDFAKFTEGEGNKDFEMLSGGWFVPTDASGSNIPEDAQAAYDNALSTVCWEWGEVEPLAYLGSQVVSGTNYAILCKGELTEDPSNERVFIVTIYEDLDGNASVSNSNVLDLIELTEA